LDLPPSTNDNGFPATGHRVARRKKLHEHIEKNMIEFTLMRDALRGHIR